MKCVNNRLCMCCSERFTQTCANSASDRENDIHNVLELSAPMELQFIGRHFAIHATALVRTPMKSIRIERYAIYVHLL